MKKHFKSHKVIWVIKSESIFLQGNSSISHQMTGMPHNVGDAVQWQLIIALAYVFIYSLVFAGLRLKVKTVFTIKQALYQIAAPQMNSRGRAEHSIPTTNQDAPTGWESSYFLLREEGDEHLQTSSPSLWVLSQKGPSAVNQNYSEKKCICLTHRLLKVILLWKSQPNNYFYCSYITIAIINNLGTI